MKLDIKHRAKSLNAIYGNTSLISSLNSYIESPESFPSVILLAGPSGCGKTTIAKIIPKKLGIKHVIELNVADSRKLEDARNIIEDLKYTSLQGTGKIVILNECHEAIKQFHDALLEIMEEPPEKTYFILCTTDPQKLPVAVKTRTTPFYVTALSNNDMKSFVKKICRREKIKINSTDIIKIIVAAEGIPRTALMILNGLKNVKPKKYKEVIENFTLEEDKQIIDLCRALLEGQSYNQIMTIAKYIEDKDAEKARRTILRYMMKVLMSKPDKRAARIMNNLWDSWFYIGKPGMILSLYSILEKD